MRSTTAKITLFTLAALIAATAGCRNPFCPMEEPYVVIDRPPPTGTVQLLARVVTFGWHGGTADDPKFIRYLCTQVIDTNGTYDPDFDIVRDLNENPWRYEHLWSRHIRYDDPRGRGREVTIGVTDTLELYKKYVFAVQAINRCGQYTRTFYLDRDARLFIPSKKAAPLLTISERNLGSFKFVGTTMPPAKVDLLSGASLRFTWQADASSYGSEIATYRYGWNVQDPNDPSDWNTLPSPDITSAPERKLYSGTHTFMVEAVDKAQNVTIGVIEIEVIPLTMERNLLWVDDYYSTEFLQIAYYNPTESEHDNFWLDICNRVDGFVPERDVYDCEEHAVKPPKQADIAHYKNIIWTYSNVEHHTAWFSIVKFIPEDFDISNSMKTINYIPIFLSRGGHIWTLGRADRRSGLYESFQSPPLLPASLPDDIDPNDPLDTSYENCMAYRDYCVTVIDKIVGTFRTGDDMPPGVVRRSAYYDVMTYGYRADDDGVTVLYPGLPERVELWEQVTECPQCYFRPNGPVGGFTYVEVYDPQYYMDFKGLYNRECFHPIYRMRTRSSLSVLNDQAVALWITRYDDVVPDVESGTGYAAKSLHFGFPLWFFDRDQVDSIVDVVFNEWHLPRR